MNILQLNDFVSERVKVKSVTNAELDMIRKKAAILKFDKKNVTCGTIVMLRDDTLGVYLDGDIAYEMAELFHFGPTAKEEPFYLNIHDKVSYKGAYLCTSSFNNDLTHCDGNNLDIIRIYDNPLTIDELATLETKGFYHYLKDFAESRKYIERS